MSDDQNTNNSLVKKALLILLFSGIGYVVFLGIVILSLCQILYLILSGKKNSAVADLIQGLSTYITKVISYISMQSDQKPFPN